MNRALHMALGLLILACFVSATMIARESTHLQRTRIELFTTTPASATPASATPASPTLTVDEQMASAPITQVPASEMETYAFPDIEAAFGALQERLATMEENAVKFIEARDILNVVDKDSVRYAAA